MSDDLPDGDGQDQTCNRNESKQCYVAIISFESDFVPFETTYADMLTQFFTDWNNIRTGVRSYNIIDEYEPFRELVNMPNYVKELCNVQHVANAMAELSSYGPPPATFLFCHGMKGNENTPAFINFGEDRHVDTRHVWARRPKSGVVDDEAHNWEDQVFLHNFIKNSGVVFLMSCYSHQIVGDYVSELTEAELLVEMPEILFFRVDLLNKTTQVILLALLTNLIDSDDSIHVDPSGFELFKAEKRSIITILKIVKWCNNGFYDIDEFWKFLLDIGCISKYESEKQKQGLPIPVTRHRHRDLKAHYQVFGHVYHDYIPNQQKEVIFNDFKALTLISRKKEHIVYQTYESVDPLPSELSSDLPSDSRSKLWYALRNYENGQRSEQEKRREQKKLKTKQK